MPNALNITPSSALLAAGQAITFSATDAADQPASVSWTLTPQLGTLLPPPAAAGQPPIPSVSATYIAPSVVQTAQTAALTAASSLGTASVTICLTPNSISILPETVCLHAGQKQQFEAIVPGRYEVTWILSPEVGSMINGMYTAPDVIPDDGTLTVTAASKELGLHADARVTLSPQPWRGFGAFLLACYILLVFGVVFFIIGLWPNQNVNLDDAKAPVSQTQSSLGTAPETGTQSGTNPTPLNKPSGPAAKSPPTATGKTTANSDLTTANNPTSSDANHEPSDDKSKSPAKSPYVQTWLQPRMNLELDLILLVLLAGALGSFLHMAQSYSAFAGNRTLKSSWVWWYCLLPFVGAGLALVIYAALRGGMITLSTTPPVDANQLNPFALVAAAALAGMFSKAANNKLGEVFDTIFQTSRGKQTKDPLKPDSQTGSQPANAGAQGGAAPVAK